MSASTWTYNSSNELTARGTWTYTYDNDGNLATRFVVATATFTWDFENRMVQAAQPFTPPTTTFKYDPFGRRIYKSSSLGTSIYVYDGDNLIEELDANGNQVARYTQGLGIDEPLAMLRAGVTSFYEADGLGSVTSLTNTSGAVAQTYAYDSFGKPTASTGTLTNPYRFTGRELDTETGQYYNRARYYGPYMGGRFLSEDPVRFSADVNFYRYVSNGVTNSVDPTGLATRGWHYGTTFDLAKTIFGPKCEDKAKTVAQADDSVDDTVSFWGFMRLITFQGDGWDKPGPHFPNPANAETGLNIALRTCDQKGLGRALHSLQDYYFHYGVSPFSHYLNFPWDAEVLILNHFKSVPRVELTIQSTASWLRAFKAKFLQCCN